MTIHKVKVSIDAFCNECKEWKLQGNSDDPVDVFNDAYEHTENTGHMVTITGYTKAEAKVSTLRESIASLPLPTLLNIFEHGSVSPETRKLMGEEIVKRAKAEGEALSHE